MENITIAVLEANSLARQQKQGEGGSRVLGTGTGGGSVRKKSQIQRSRCKECVGSGMCEHNRRRNVCNLCVGSGIFKHNRVKSAM